MAWVRIDETTPEHRKFLALASLSKRGTVGAAAAWIWTCGLAYCNRQPQRDGFIPEDAVPRLYPVICAMGLATRLVKVGLWERVDGGFLVHDYHQYQPNAARIVDHRERGRKGGLRSGMTRSKRAPTEPAAAQRQPSGAPAAAQRRTSGSPAAAQRPPSGAPAAAQRPPSGDSVSSCNDSGPVKLTDEPPSRPVPIPIPTRPDPPLSPAPSHTRAPAREDPPPSVPEWRVGIEDRWRRASGARGLSFPGVLDLARECEAAAEQLGLDPGAVFDRVVAEFLVYRRSCSPGFIPTLTPVKALQHFATLVERMTGVAPTGGEAPVIDQRGPMERAMDEFYGARERLRAARGVPGDVAIVEAWELAHPRN